MALEKTNKVSYSKMVHWEVSQMIYKVSDDQKIPFDSMTLEGKRKWLEDHVTTVIDRVIAKNGTGWEGLRKYRIFVVEREGEAILYFEKP